jgi:hypothetical protein
MKSLLRPLVGLCLFAFLAGTAHAQEKKSFTPGDKQSPGDADYFPLKVGTKWVYKTNEGKVTIQVEKHELIGKFMCAHLVGTTADGKKHSEYDRIGSDGVLRVQAGGQTLSQPLKILQLPVKAKDKWTVAPNVLGKQLKGTFTTSIVDSLTVLSNKYTGVVMVKSDDFTVDGQNVPHTYYFARGIGIVKQVVTFANQEIIVELESFTPAEK